MSAVEFRRASAHDREAILEVMSQAFDRPSGSERYERDRETLARHIETHWVLVRSGEIVGALHVFWEEMQVGQAVITKADIGEVCIAPSCQSEGLGTMLMQKAVEQLRADGYYLSRLGGYRRFYERFGWVPFPRGSIDFVLQGLTSRGGFTDPLRFLHRPEEEACIRPYDGRRDAEACAALYAAFNSGRTGAVPGHSFGTASGNPWRVVYEVDGRVQAYVFASEEAPPHTRMSPAVSISNGAGHPDDLRPLESTLRYILRRAAMAGAESVKARLPLDPALYDLYRDASCGFIPSLWQSSEGGNMLQVLSVRGLFAALVGELTQRLQSAEHPSSAVDICVRDESVRLAWNGTELMLTEGDANGVQVGQDGLMKMVLGLVPVEQVLRAEGEAVAMLRAMFPVQGTATGLWG